MSIIAVAGSAFTFYIPGLEDQANPGLFKSNPTIAAGDFTISINGGATDSLDNTPTVSPAAGTQIKIILSATETTAAADGGKVTVLCQDSAGDEWYSVGVVVDVRAADLSVLTGTAQTGDSYAVVTNATYGLDKLARTGADSDTLETLSDQLDLISGSAGSGALAVTVTVNDENSLPLDGVECWITTDSAGTNVVAGTLSTDALGVVTFMLDAGAYYLWRQLSGYNFTNPTAITVS